LATALGYAARQHGHNILFANAIDVINTLSAAQTYLPIDQRGADLLFQVIIQRYERGSIILTSNKAFKQWPAIYRYNAWAAIRKRAKAVGFLTPAFYP
jgi:DNA replication protein DnaC